jgi:hypothetical protein
MERKSKYAIIEDVEFRVIKEPISKTRCLASLKKGEYLHVARLRPDWKKILLKRGLIRKIRIDGKEHLTDGIRYLKEPELGSKPEQTQHKRAKS